MYPNSNYPSNYGGGGGGYRPYGGGGGGGNYGGGGGYGNNMPPRQPLAEDTLKTETFQVERKTFVITLKENVRGRFLRITEDVNGRRDSIIIPSSGFADFKRVMDEALKISAEIPEKMHVSSQPTGPGVQQPHYPQQPPPPLQ